MGPLDSIVRAIVRAMEWFWGQLAGIGTGIKESLMDVPIWNVRVALALAFLALAIGCLCFSKKYAMEGAERTTWWNDPRRWAVVVLALQIALYLCL